MFHIRTRWPEHNDCKQRGEVTAIQSLCFSQDCGAVTLLCCSIQCDPETVFHSLHLFKCVLINTAKQRGLNVMFTLSLSWPSHSLTYEGERVHSCRNYALAHAWPQFVTSSKETAVVFSQRFSCPTRHARAGWKRLRILYTYPLHFFCPTRDARVKRPRIWFFWSSKCNCTNFRPLSRTVYITYAPPIISPQSQNTKRIVPN
jgi:hypothetical protein